MGRSKILYFALLAVVFNLGKYRRFTMYFSISIGEYNYYFMYVSYFTGCISKRGRH